MTTSPSHPLFNRLESDETWTVPPGGPLDTAVARYADNPPTPPSDAEIVSTALAHVPFGRFVRSVGPIQAADPSTPVLQRLLDGSHPDAAVTAVHRSRADAIRKAGWLEQVFGAEHTQRVCALLSTVS